MEQVYRRRSISTHKRNQSHAPRLTGYRATVVKQSVLCIILFIFCLVAMLSTKPELQKVKDSISLVINTQTDFKSLPHQLHGFIKTYILKQEDKTLTGKEVLTSLGVPLTAPVTSTFGPRTDDATGTEAFHYGVDIAANEGEKIKCSAPGKVAEAGESADYGRYLLIDHGNEVYTLYAHCLEVLPQSGDAVLADQVIATVGATGNATGPHLHFELRNGDTWLDPSEFITFPQANQND
ncbi:MAG: M23 family metallopeptidase [Clostridia bacterium]|nr:M23 family metallopeptidase [Clostridia bacterium]